MEIRAALGEHDEADLGTKGHSFGHRWVGAHGWWRRHPAFSETAKDCRASLLNVRNMPDEWLVLGCSDEIFSLCDAWADRVQKARSCADERRCGDFMVVTT